MKQMILTEACAIQIVSGAFNQAAAKKCDLEAWFPFQQEWKELVSCKPIIKPDQVHTGY